MVDLVAEHTLRSRALVRRQLGELLDLCEAPLPVRVSRVSPAAAPSPARPSPVAPSPVASSPTPSRAEPGPVDPIERLVVSLEGHLDDLTRQVKADVTPLAVATVREHVGLALLVAGGLGLMLGLVLGALGYPHSSPDAEGPRGDPD